MIFRINKYLFSALLCLAFGGATAQTAHYYLRQGDSHYEFEDYALAEESYRKANEKDKNLQTRFNLGNSIYKQQRYEEAIQYFEEAANSSGDLKQKANAYYNLGNTHLRNQDIEASVEAYKEALRLVPDDFESKRNLYLAKLMQKQEQQEQEQEQQQDQQQDQNQDEQQEQDQQQDQQENQDQDSEQQDAQQQQSGDEPSSGGEEEGAEPTQDLSKEDAEKLLQVIEGEEKKVQEKLRKISGDRKKPEKDW